MREITILVRFLVVFVICNKCASTEEFIAFSLTETVLFLLFRFNILERFSLAKEKK